MTANEAKARLVTWLNEQVGYPEGAGNWNKYAADPRLTQLLGWDAQKQLWCDLFTDEAFIDCFGLENAAAMTYQPIGKGSAACRYSAQLFQKNNAWSTTPEVGAVIFFYDSARVINHQGIVTQVGMGAITTVEGNKSDKVSRCTYPIGAASIAGYGIPKWSVVADEPTEEIPVVDEPAEEQGDTYKLEYHILRYGAGMTGQEQLREEVRSVQQRLRWMGFDIGAWGADGEYGNDTANAVRQYQRSVGLRPDGEFGPLTRGRMDGLVI